jgi:large subunit ribosomal protein L7/L12
MSSVDKIAKELSSLTVLEVVSLIDTLKAEWNISDADLAPAAAVAVAPSAGVVAEEKDSFEVILASSGENKMNVIKEVKNLLGFSLKDAKDLVDAAPKSLKSDVSKKDAEDLKSKLEAVGAKVELK